MQQHYGDLETRLIGRPNTMKDTDSIAKLGFRLDMIIKAEMMRIAG